MDLFGTTGQERRAWINNQGDRFANALNYYLGPTGIPDKLNALAQAAEFTDAGDFMEAGDASRALVRDPSISNAARMSAAGAALAIPFVSARMMNEGTDILGSVVDDFMTGYDPNRLGANFGNRTPLVVHHNTSANKLAFTDELGGMPYPSLAISRADAPLENFGDISLLGGPEMAVPNRSNRVFPGDGYTVRQPRGELQLVDDRAFVAAMRADPRFSHLRDTSYWMGSFDNVERADEALKTVQAAIAEGMDPRQFDQFRDMLDAARRHIGYRTPEGVGGLSEFGATERVLPQGFTNSGNHRRPKPYTLDNVMAEMRKEAKNAGAEGFNYGPASFRANASRPFSRFSEVSSARDMIQAPEATEAAFEAFSGDYSRLMEEIAATTGQGGWRGADAASSYMNDYAAGRTRDWRGVEWVDNMAPDLQGRINALARQSRETPVNYFEAKPQRAVSLGEFEAAIIPEGADEAAQILERSGVRQILRYGSPEQRRELFQRFPELMFSVGGVGMVSGAMQQQSEEERSNDIRALLDKYGVQY
jgi:hypothetical protein